MTISVLAPLDHRSARGNCLPSVVVDPNVSGVPARPFNTKVSMPPTCPSMMSKPSVSPVALAFQVIVSLPVPARITSSPRPPLDPIVAVAGIDPVVVGAGIDCVDAPPDKMMSLPPPLLMCRRCRRERRSCSAGAARNVDAVRSRSTVTVVASVACGGARTVIDGVLEAAIGGVVGNHSDDAGAGDRRSQPSDIAYRQ